jgi:hypothetical protein
MTRINGGSYQQTFKIDNSNCNGPHEPETTNDKTYGQPRKKFLEAEDEDITPLGSDEKTNLVFSVVLDQGQIYTDLAGSFPTSSSKGNNGLMICYSYDTNNSRPIAMKSKSCAEWVRVFGVVFN